MRWDFWLFSTSLAMTAFGGEWGGYTVPVGYFSIFKELADIFVMLIRNGANVGPQFVPDISVGQLWSKYWTAESLDIIHGERIKYEHNYPLYYPQSVSNPQHPYCYP